MVCPAASKRVDEPTAEFGHLERLVGLGRRGRRRDAMDVRTTTTTTRCGCYIIRRSIHASRTHCRGVGVLCRLERCGLPRIGRDHFCALARRTVDYLVTRGVYGPGRVFGTEMETTTRLDDLDTAGGHGSGHDDGVTLLVVIVRVAICLFSSSRGHGTGYFGPSLAKGLLLASINPHFVDSNLVYWFVATSLD